MKLSLNALHYQAGKAASLLCGVLLSACQSTWNVEADFGSTVNEAVKLQTVNPDAQDINHSNQVGLDGSAAKSAVDNYQRSLETKSGTGAYPGGGVLSPSNSGSSGVNTR